jgi:hypothetical protein
MLPLCTYLPQSTYGYVKTFQRNPAICVNLITWAYLKMRSLYTYAALFLYNSLTFLNKKLTHFSGFVSKNK